MTRQKALHYVFVLWLVADILLAALLTIQIIAGKYGADSAVAASWLSAQIVPVMGVLLAATFASPSAAWKNAKVTSNRYVLALAVSAIQILAIVITIAIEPFVEDSPFVLFDQTIGYFSVWQGVVTACVGGLVFDGR